MLYFPTICICCICFGSALRSTAPQYPRSRTPPKFAFPTSDALHLFSNGALEYTVDPAMSTMCSLFGWCSSPRKARTIKINLSRNLEIKRSDKDDTTLEIMDRCTNLPLPDFPGKFDSAEHLDRWFQQLEDIMKYDQSYDSLHKILKHCNNTEEYIGAHLNDRVCLRYSKSPVFCGVVVFIGNINQSKYVSIAIRIGKEEISSTRFMHYIRSDMISNGWFDDIQYFNYQHSDATKGDIFLVLDAMEMFQSLEAEGINPLTNTAGLLYEAKHFFTLTMEQIWSKLEGMLRTHDIQLLPNAVGRVNALHFDSVTLTNGKLNIRIFNYEDLRTSSKPTLLAKIKVFGVIDANVHFRKSDGRKYRGSEMEIPEMYMEGDIAVKYQLLSSQKFSQLILMGFVQRPSVEFLNVKYTQSFPKELFGNTFVDPVQGLQSVIEDLLELRGADNSFSIQFDSPFDS